MRFFYITILVAVFVFFTSIYYLFTPISINEEKVIEIKFGTSLTQAVKMLEEKDLVRSNEVFLIFSKLIHPEGIIAGTYYFTETTNMFNIINNISRGIYGKDLIKLTIPEGFTNTDVIERILKMFPHMDKTKLQSLFIDKEGYIFPETYFFDTNINEENLYNNINDWSKVKIEDIIDPLKLESKEAEKILIIASLIETEGKTKDERYMISGIIQNRLKINMPLQLDATLKYITGKGSSQLTLADLKINSPYNTYTNTGLPPKPIANPGKESMLAAMNPKENDYFYYLHGSDGKIHYAKTFAEHVSNKNKYLK